MRPLSGSLIMLMIFCYTWEKLYKDILNEFTKARRAKVMTHKQPWIDRELKKLMNERYK